MRTLVVRAKQELGSIKVQRNVSVVLMAVKRVQTRIPARVVVLTGTLMEIYVLKHVLRPNGEMITTTNVWLAHLLVKTVKVQAISVPLVPVENTFRIINV